MGEGVWVAVAVGITCVGEDSGVTPRVVGSDTIPAGVETVPGVQATRTSHNIMIVEDTRLWNMITSLECVSSNQSSGEPARPDINLTFIF